MNRKVPAFATWLLERFGVKRQNEALMGDLAEEYQAGKSWAWYWWQTLAAIFVTVIRDVREHKLLALRAVAMGWVLSLALPLTRSYVEGVYLYPRSLHWSTNFLLAYVSSVLVWGFIQWPLIGWLVARAHRTHAAVLALTVGISRIFVAALSEIYYSFAGFHILKSLNDHPQFIFFIILALAQQIVLIVAGGLLVKPKTGPEQPLATIAHPAS